MTRPTDDPMPERQPHDDAEGGREPEWLSARLGTRKVSHAALVERVAAAVYEEHGYDIQRAPLTRAERLHRLRETVDYVLAVESVVLTAESLARLIRETYSHVFGFGPLDAIFADPRITTIVLDGPERAAARYEHGELVALAPLFDDAAHQREMIARLLAEAGAEMRDDLSVIETGLTVEGRRVALSVVMPSAAIALSATIRLHPATPPTFETLLEGGMFTADAGHFLAALTASPYGFIVVGDTESGKTTLLGALANRLPDTMGLAAVERAGELWLPDAAARYPVRWPVDDQPGLSFGEQIHAALADAPDVLLLDEVRADDPAAIVPLLMGEQTPRQMWAFRGKPDAKRLQAALGMLARRGGGEAAVHALYDRLPFVVSVAQIQGRLQLFSIGEWQPSDASEYPDLVLLYQYRDGAARRTDRQPHRPVAPG